MPRLEHLSVGCAPPRSEGACFPRRRLALPPSAAASDTASDNPPLGVPQPYTPERKSSISPPGQAALPCSRPVPERPVTSSRAGTGLDHTGHRAAHKSPFIGHGPDRGANHAFSQLPGFTDQFIGIPQILPREGVGGQAGRIPVGVGRDGDGYDREQVLVRRRVAVRNTVGPRHPEPPAQPIGDQHLRRGAERTRRCTGSVSGTAGKRDPSAPTECGPAARTWADLSPRPRPAGRSPPRVRRTPAVRRRFT